MPSYSGMRVLIQVQASERMKLKYVVDSRLFFHYLAFGIILKLRKIINNFLRGGLAQN